MGASLGGAVTDTVLVVLVLAQAGHVTRVAVKLGGLGVHVLDAHLLCDHHRLALTQKDPTPVTYDERQSGTYRAVRGGHLGSDHGGRSQQGKSNA